MSVQQDEKLRMMMVNYVFTPLHGMSLGEWMRLLYRHHFAVEPVYWLRAGFMTVGNTVTSAFRLYEDQVFGPKISRVQVQPPLFILGHWRSGTTYLYNLLSNDQQFAYPDLWEVLNPHTFLTTERFGKHLQAIAPRTRLSDNVRLTADSPLEDQFATTGTLRSALLRWAFPHSAAYYDRYLTFRGVPREEVEQWKAALLRFYQKLTWKYNRPLLLKSPHHTARIKLLLELFPDARFIHIYRNPFSVFKSTRRQAMVASRVMRLQSGEPVNLDRWIMERYKTLYDCFFEEQLLIPPAQFAEVRYEDLAADPLGQTERLYQDLNLPGYAALRPTLESYITGLGVYRRNQYDDIDPALRSQLSRAWVRNFELWGYPASET